MYICIMNEQQQWQNILKTCYSLLGAYKEPQTYKEPYTPLPQEKPAVSLKMPLNTKL